MNTAVAIDNVTEILNKILEFTDRRKQLLTRNVLEMNAPGFVPMDLDDDGFARVMTVALSEHVATRRLMLCDCDTLKFGAEGQFESVPVEDPRAAEILMSSPKDYLDYQVRKLSENWLNRKVTVALLRQKQS